MLTRTLATFGILAIGSPVIAADCARNFSPETPVIEMLFCVVKMNAELERLQAEVDTLKRASSDNLPRNTVIAVDDPRGCPTGWAPFTQADGRFILGVTQGKSRLSTRFYAEDGGEETVTITEQQMPRHKHSYRDRSVASRGTAEMMTDGPLRGWQDLERETWPAGGTSSSDALPHNNMPPYIALYFCKKN